MDPIMMKAFESRLKEVELKVSAILELLKLELHYEPEKYTLVKPEGDDNE